MRLNVKVLAILCSGLFFLCIILCLLEPFMLPLSQIQAKPMNTKLIVNTVHERARKYGERSAYRYRIEATGEWISVSWNTFSKQIISAAKAVALMGIKEFEHVAVYSQNMPEMIVTDYALFSNR